MEDVAPSVGNFRTPLKGYFGPFLMRDSGAPAGYVGDPNVEHTVTGSPTGFNQFSVSGGGLNQSTNLFTIHGKIASNTGVTGDRAIVGNGFVDVFATSRGTQLEVVAGEGYARTPMEYDDGTQRRYARIALAAGAPTPTEIVARNIGDDPVSTTTSPVGAITVTRAEYDDTHLVVNASAVGSGTLTAEGFGELASGAGSFPVNAPPASITVTDGRTRTTVPVTISGGAASPAGLPPVDPGPDVPPVVETGGDTGGGTTTPVTLPGAPTAVTATPGLGSVALSWTAPVGDAPVTGYTVTTTGPAGTTTAPVDVTGTTATVTGLTNGTQYTFTVAAKNSAGTGTASATAIAKPGDTLTGRV